MLTSRRLIGTITRRSSRSLGVEPRGIIKLMNELDRQKSSVRQRADQIKEYRCKNLIAVIENPKDIKNIGTIIRNVNALGVEKAYIVDPKKALPDDWQEMREKRALSKTSVSAIKWSFVKRFDSTEACIDHLEQNRFVSIVTSPHLKGQEKRCPRRG